MVLGGFGGGGAGRARLLLEAGKWEGLGVLGLTVEGLLPLSFPLRCMFLFHRSFC